MSRPSPNPKYRHYKPKDLAVVRLDGRDVYLGKYDSPESWEKYHRLMAERHRSGPAPSPATSGVSGVASDMTVGELILRFMAARDAYYRRADGSSTGELENYRSAFRPLARLYSRAPAHDFGPLALKRVRQAMIDAGWARTGVNRQCKRIRALFAYAASEELLPVAIHQALGTVEPIRKGRTKAREPRGIGPASEAMVQAVKPYVARQVWAMIEVQRLTGMRPGEVCHLRGCDLDMTQSPWVYEPEAHKTAHHGKARRIYFGPRAQAVILPWLRADQGYLFQPIEARQEWDVARRSARRCPMTPSQSKRRPKRKPKRSPGDHYTVGSYSRAIVQGCQRAYPHPREAELREAIASAPAGSKREARRAFSRWRKENKAELRQWLRENHWHPNQLRHSAATALRRDFDIDTARVVLGHSSPATTETYAEMDEGKARAAMLAVG